MKNILIVNNLNIKHIYNNINNTMASQDNQVIQTVTETGQTTTIDTVRNVTGYIHFNKDDDLTKIFETLHTFRTSHRLKYYHHRDGFIFFSVKSDCLSELAKVQPFKISHYSSKSTYSCDKTVADKLVAVRDSFVRLSWDETSGTVQFLSRTIGRVHNDLVRRVFKSADEVFVRTNYHFIPHVQSGADGEEVVSEGTDETTRGTRAPRIPREATATGEGETRVFRGGRGGFSTRGSRGGFSTRGGRGGFSTRGAHQDSADGFTRVVRDKSKYNNNRVRVEGEVPRVPRAPRGRAVPPTA